MVYRNAGPQGSGKVIGPKNLYREVEGLACDGGGFVCSRSTTVGQTRCQNVRRLTQLLVHIR